MGLKLTKNKSPQQSGVESSNSRSIHTSDVRPTEHESNDSHNQTLVDQNRHQSEENMIKSIQLFHVFDDSKGYNILFVTNRGLVYGLGSNYWGSLGFGHNLYVSEIQVIDRLCHKNITQFFNGVDFVLALTQHNCLYGWGLNDFGQLGLELPNMDFPLIKPELINPENMENKSISQISCGFYHTMILTSDGCVYGWGYNRYGQLGCGPDYGIRKGFTFRVNFSPNHEIKSIYCCDYSSFAITSEGQVFSWGGNAWHNLGHNSSDNIWKPQLIEDMTGIKTICSGGNITYFLSNDGFIHFCGRYMNENNEYLIQILPKVLNTDKRFTEINLIFSHKYDMYLFNGIMNGKIYNIKNQLNDNIIETNYTNFFDCFTNMFKMTHKTIDLCDYKEYNYKNCEEFIAKCLDYLEKVFSSIKELSNNGMNWVEVSFIEYVQTVSH